MDNKKPVGSVSVKFSNSNCLFAIEIFNRGAWLPVSVGPIDNPVQLLAENIEMAVKLIDLCKEAHKRRGLVYPEFRYRLLSEKEKKERELYFIRNKIKKEDMVQTLKKGINGG